MNLLIRRGISMARVNWGRWIADCSSPYCRSAMRLPPGWAVFICHDCGEPTEVIWPVPEMTDGIERLLCMRPDPVTRNWEPGEMLADLLTENMLHGVLPGSQAEIDAHPGGVLLAIADNKIIADALPAPVRRHEIGE